MKIKSQDLIVNKSPINNIRYLNKYFKKINQSLKNGGKFEGIVETYPNRRNAILSRHPPLLNNIIYIFDYIFNRIIPKLSLTKNFYFSITKGKNRVISKAETFGRLYSCGFELLEERTENNLLYFSVIKVKEPFHDINTKYGLIVKLKRIGFKGKTFNVYKLRTMHPYSEYLQEYIYKKNKLKGGGKIKDDFRISTEGAFVRKIWLDEIPMIYNVIKGDMKLVGVRPLSPHYFSLYSKKLKSMRIKTKPGLIPPFYADMPETLDEIMDSEIKYLDLYNKNFVITDISYFFKAFYNIVIKRKRSS